MEAFTEILGFLFVLIIGTILYSIPILCIYLVLKKIYNRDKKIYDLLKETLKSKKRIILISLSGFLFLIYTSVFFWQKSLSPIPQKDDVNRLVMGKLAYDIQDTMKVGNLSRATVSITKALNDSILFSSLNSTHFTTKEVKVSSKVKVVLLDPSDKQNFSINPLNTEEQFVDDTTNTIWLWNIVPLRSGENDLLLRATVNVITDLGETPRDIPIFEKKVTVQASPFKATNQFFQDNWQWIAGTILIPLLLWGYKRIKTKKKKPVTVTGFGGHVKSK